MAACPVEFTLQALRAVEDISAVARELSKRAQQGVVLCGQSDPDVRQLHIDTLRIGYRIESDLITVLWAEVDPTRIH